MKQNKFGEIVYTENDIFNSVMRGIDINEFKNAVVEFSTEKLSKHFFDSEFVNSLRSPADDGLTVEDYDLSCQENLLMPAEYKQFDIAEYILEQCTTQEQLQRVGKELLLYQERNMFPLLQYMKYLVDTMRENDIVWGVGRGSSVASYVLYLIGVHRIDSIYYNLDVEEFLR